MLDEGVQPELGMYKLQLNDLSFHRSSLPALDVSSENVQRLMKGSEGNYAKFDKWLWSLGNRITLLWVRDSLVTNLSWADEADNDVVIPITPAKSPKVKKRKLGSEAP